MYLERATGVGLWTRVPVHLTPSILEQCILACMNNEMEIRETQSVSLVRCMIESVLSVKDGRKELGLGQASSNRGFSEKETLTLMGIRVRP